MFDMQLFVWKGLNCTDWNIIDMSPFKDTTVHDEWAKCIWHSEKCAIENVHKNH